MTPLAGRVNGVQDDVCEQVRDGGSTPSQSALASAISYYQRPAAGATIERDSQVAYARIESIVC
jgi:hypothetical protein